MKRNNLKMTQLILKNLMQTSGNEQQQDLAEGSKENLPKIGWIIHVEIVIDNFRKVDGEKQIKPLFCQHLQVKKGWRLNYISCSTICCWRDYGVLAEKLERCDRCENKKVFCSQLINGNVMNTTTASLLKLWSTNESFHF